jgi:hypothetical protein
MFHKCMNALSTVTRIPLRGRFLNEVTRKAKVCASVLTEARRLTDQTRFGPLLNQLVARACELLDELDEILISLDPLRDGDDFATAAMLHRELEHVQAAIAAQWRKERSI